MRNVSCYLFSLIIFVFGCTEENVIEVQDIEEGKFVLELYNSSGDLLLKKRGDAQSIVGYGDFWEIRLMDPDFGIQNSNPLEIFASLSFFGQIDLDAPQELQFNSSNNYAAFFQRWYSLDDDWGYRSTNGKLNISSVEESAITGSFSITLKVAEGDQQNPLWGERIIAKGYFSSK